MEFQQDIEKGNGEIIRVEISEFRGQHYLNIRNWYTDKVSQEYKPTQKGIAIRLDLYPEVKKAIIEAEEVIQSENHTDAGS